MKRTAKDKKILDAFASEFWFCWACGWSPNCPWRTWHVGKLDIAHIAGGAGRHHDRENLVRLCAGCHRLLHGDRINVDPWGYLPRLELAHILWLKEVFDPSWYDRDYLRTARANRHLPRKKKLPYWQVREFHIRHGDHKSFAEKMRQIMSNWPYNRL